MKIIYICILIFLNLTFNESNSCDNLMSEVKRYGTLKDSRTPYNSSAISKAEYYTHNNEGFAIIFFKKDGNSFVSTPYIYCNVSSQRWKVFVDDGSNGSWGESFNKYIKSYKCNC